MTSAKADAASLMCRKECTSLLMTSHAQELFLVFVRVSALWRGTPVLQVTVWYILFIHNHRHSIFTDSK